MTFLYIIVALAIVFDFINGFHDSANSIATVVSTKVLSPLLGMIIGFNISTIVQYFARNHTPKIFWAWIFTIPVSGLMGAVIYFLFNLINISSI